MKFRKLVLNNFGLYRGKHEILLETKSFRRPIILIGGLNGAGKTTILEAIKYLLYGKFAELSSNENNSYLETIKSYINRDNKYEGASIELEIESLSGYKDKIWLVQRYWTWTKNYKQLKEHLNVFDIDPKNNIRRRNNDLSERWFEYIQEFIPNQISSLFFFDGEKIEEFANPYSSSDVLKTAVSSLFGIKTLERLQKDLMIFEKKILKDKGNDNSLLPIHALYEEIEFIENELNRLEGEKKELNKRIKILSEKDFTLEKRYKDIGGELAEQREELLIDKDEKESQIAQLRDELIEESSGALPLLLTRNIIEQINIQDYREKESEKSKRFVKILKERDENLLNTLQKHSNYEDFKEIISTFFYNDLEKRQKLIIDNEYLKIDKTTSNHLFKIKSIFINAKSTAQEISSKLYNVKDQLESLHEKINSVPPDEKIKPILEERNNLKLEKDELKNRYRRIEEELNSKEFVYEKKKREYLNKAQSVFNKKINSNNEQRFIHYSTSSRDLIDEFKEKLVSKNIQKIEKYILESFQHLLRKKNFIKNFTIDTDSFNMKLHTDKGELITTERLSAGERQLLATAMLWGLARASGKPLPTIIDTPLGRLDSLHRENLAKLYFPNASHQVILLSTDKEFDKEYYDMIKPYISREYTLKYSHEDKSTIVEKGYNIKRELIYEY